MDGSFKTGRFYVRHESDPEGDLVCRSPTRLARKATGMGGLPNLLDRQGRLLRKAEQSPNRGPAYLERRAKYRAHRSISRAYRVLQRSAPRIHRHGLEFATVYANIARGFFCLRNPKTAWPGAKKR